MQKKKLPGKSKRLFQKVIDIFIVPLLLISIALSISVSLIFFKRPASLGILFSSIMTGFLTIPLTLLLRPKFRSALRKSDEAIESEAAQSQKEVNLLKQENLDYKNREDFYRHQIQLLENLTFNMETYSDVFKICFRDYQQTATIKQRERYNESDYTNALNKLIGNSSKNYDELVAVMDCIVTYQRGVDLQNIRITEVGWDSIVVSGIIPEYTSRPVFDYRDFFTEIRHVKLGKSGEPNHISVLQNTNVSRILEEKVSECRQQFEESFLSGQNQYEDSTEIIRRAQDFIKVILQPLYPKIEFSGETPAAESRPLLDYLRIQTEQYKKLLSSQENKDFKKEFENE